VAGDECEPHDDEEEMCAWCDREFTLELPTMRLLPGGVVCSKECEDALRQETHSLFHRLWTHGTGSADYDKQEWNRLSLLLLYLSV
jgi:hypothetical protein